METMIKKSESEKDSAHVCPACGEVIVRDIDQNKLCSACERQDASEAFELEFRGFPE